MSKLPTKAHSHPGGGKGKGKPTQKKYKDQFLHGKWSWGWKNSLSLGETGRAGADFAVCSEGTREKRSFPPTCQEA